MLTSKFIFLSFTLPPLQCRWSEPASVGRQGQVLRKDRTVGWWCKFLGWYEKWGRGGGQVFKK